jgi:reactive intermediate/imine deaminase
MIKQIIQTTDAPQAIGTYSQAVRAGQTVYLSGQIPLIPETMSLVDGDIAVQINQVFRNLLAVVNAVGGGFDDIVKLNVYLTDLTDFPVVNAIMAELFQAPFPARAVVGVTALPKGASVEIDAIMVLKPQEYPAS